MRLYIYDDHSIVKVKFYRKTWQKKHYLQTDSFSKNIKCDESFHVQEDCQNIFFYRPLLPKFFLYQIVTIFTLGRLSFRLRLQLVNPG